MLHFEKNKNTDGLTYYQRNRERLLEKSKINQEKNKEKRKLYMKEYSKKNKEKLDGYRKEYRNKTKDKRKEYDKNYRLINHAKVYARDNKYGETIEGRIARWKNGANQRKKEWNINIDYIKGLPLICHYTGMDLTLKRNKINTVSLDRVDSSKGYVEGNVVLCSSQVNIMKHMLSEEEFYSICKMVVEHKDNIE